MSCIVDTDVFQSAMLFLSSAMSSASHVSYCFTELVACLCLQTQLAQARGRVIPPFLPAPSPLTSQRSISRWVWGLISKGQVTTWDYIWQCLLESRQLCWVPSSATWLLWISPHGAASSAGGTFSSKSAVSFLGNHFKRNYDFPVVYMCFLWKPHALHFMWAAEVIFLHFGTLPAFP